MKNLLEIADIGFKKNLDFIAFADKQDGVWREVTVDTFRQGLEAFSVGLYQMGIRQNDKVVLHCENRVEWVMCDLAILAIGAVTVPIYTTQPPDQIAFILQDSGSKAYIVSGDKMYAAVKDIIPKFPTVKWIGIDKAFEASFASLEEIQNIGKAFLQQEPKLLEKIKEEINPEQLASIIYTSGTTGVPKGVMLSHKNIVSNIIALAEAESFIDKTPKKGKRILSYLPLSHIFERTMSYVAIYFGVPMYFVQLDSIMDDFQFVKPNHFTSVPRLLEKVYRGVQTKMEAEKGVKGKIGRWGLKLAMAYRVGKPLPYPEWQYKLADKLVFSKIRARFGGNLYGITTGGAALPEKVMHFFNALGIKCGQGYGLTETSPVVSFYDVNDLNSHSVGKVLKGVEVKIMPVENRTGEDGEIWVKGDNVMMGYWNNPTATAEVLEDGWFKTGDIGKFDAHKNLCITDRKKELMKLSTGKYVAPAPIESELMLSPFIEQCVVVGHNRKFCAALIVPNREVFKERIPSLPDENWVADLEIQKVVAEAVQKANEHLPPWEKVKDFRFISHPFTIEGGELTPKMSFKKNVICQNYQHLIDDIYDKADSLSVS